MPPRIIPASADALAAFIERTTIPTKPVIHMDGSLQHSVAVQALRGAHPDATIDADLIAIPTTTHLINTINKAAEQQRFK